MNQTTEILQKLNNSGLKITPQRIAVMEAVISLGNHPTADKIIELIQTNNPNIAIGTVYKTLDTFVEKGLIKKIRTDRDTMRYDAIMDKHHHLYSSKSERIEDYFDNELDTILNQYFTKKKIPNFSVTDSTLHIIGRFADE